MSGSSRHKEKHGLKSVVSLETRNEGTSARTRPFSYDEIMLRRNSRKVSGDDEDMIVDEENISVKEIEKVSNSSVSGRGYRNSNDFWPVLNHASDDFVKVSSRKKEDNTNMTGDRLVNKRERDNRDSETKRHTSEYVVKVSSRKKEDNTAATGDRLVNKRYNDNFNSINKSRAMLNEEVRNKTKAGKDDRWDHGRKKNDERSTGHSENLHAGNLGRKDRYEQRSREKSEKESRDERRVEVDERIRERNAVKKNDSGKWDDSETSKRKEKKEPSHFHNVESRQKKRRSRSREHDKDRGRRSNSLSPRGHKRKSYNVWEQGELSSHSSKDKSKRQQSDDDRHRLSSNGTNSHYRRHGESANQLGGYSPRKRKTESAVKTPSPPHCSHLEKKSATWDLPPAGADSNLPVSVNINTSDQTVASNRNQISTVDPVSSKTVKALSGVLSNASLDSIQLTQATRPMRRIYVENLPVSASEKDVMEYLNNFLLSSGVTHVQGSEPCISCSLHKEKGQALVEFLTPEYASAALSFDGRSFSGSILKIRRPKDFVEVATGGPEKSVAAVDSISDVVRDSPHKIFVGGISKAITPEMLKEIISAFGTLKAYHFEVNVDCSDPCAFLEYVDQSVTLKACAGLSGMRLGGQVLAVVLATPNAASSVENTGSSPFYGIPEHAKPLLEKPTQVLKLQNLLDPDSLSSLSEAELEEILEDTRLECTRFGTVKAVNVVKCSDCNTNQEPQEVRENPNSSVEGEYLNCNDKKMTTNTSGEHIDCESEEISRSDPQNNGKESVEVDKAVEDGGTFVEKLPDDITEDGLCNPMQMDGKEDLESNDQIECCDDKVDVSIKTADAEMGNETTDRENLESAQDNKQMQEALTEMNVSVKTDSEAPEKDDNGESAFYLEDVFESGCVIVEYKREEAASVAAHCLHRRIFDNRIVTVGYVDYDIYKARFPK